MRFSGRVIGDHYYGDHYNILKMLTNVLTFYPPPDEVGAGGIGVASDVRPSVRPASGCPHFVSGAELGNPCIDFFNF